MSHNLEAITTIAGLLVVSWYALNGWRVPRPVAFRRPTQDERQRALEAEFGDDSRLPSEVLEDVAEPQSEEGAAPSSALVCVFVAENGWRADLLKSFLESHGIPCITGGNVPSATFAFNNMPMSQVKLFVHAGRAGEARRLLAAA